jgi:hypothetical protein
MSGWIIVIDRIVVDVGVAVQALRISVRYNRIGRYESSQLAVIPS